MALVPPQEQDVALSTESPSSLSDIDSLLSEILNDPNVFSLLESPSPAPSPQSSLCLSPSAQQLEQEALASIGQLPQQNQYPAESHRPHYPATETPSPTTPSPTIDNQTFFPTAHPHRPPSSLPICPPHSPPIQSPLINCEVALSANVCDTYLRGQRGYLISLSQTIAKVVLYSLGQECQLPCDYVELVVPAIGDYVRVVDGPLKGTVGWLINCVGTNSCIQLCNGQYMRVELRNIAKMALRGSSSAPCSSPSPLTPLTSPTSPVLSPVTPSPHHPSPAPFPSPQYSSRSTRSPYTSNASYPNNHCLRVSRAGRMATCYPHSNGTRDPRQLCNRMSGDIAQRQMAAYIRAQGGRSHMRGNHSMKHRFQLLQMANMKPLCKQQQLPSDVDRPTEEILEEVRQRAAPDYDFGSSGDGGEVSSSCIQVSLTCPLSHKRMVFPCRGTLCKHPQCFDGEAYIEFNKCALKPKEKGRNGCHSYQSAKHQVLKCPLCAKHTPFSQLYIDKVTLEIIQDTEEDEVEFDKTGSWKPVEKKSVQEEVIDLTLDDDS